MESAGIDVMKYHKIVAKDGVNPMKVIQMSTRGTALYRAQ